MTWPLQKGQLVADSDQQARFEELILPHLDAACNLARWLTGNEHDAEDVAQEAYLRAFKFFGGFRGGNSRAWLLSIVRNTSYTWLQKNRKLQAATVYEEDLHAVEDESANPELLMLKNADAQMITQALAELPVEFREVTVLREMEGMSYKEIADIAEVPIGTVMSRLARARKLLQQSLAAQLQKGGAK
jgi:RNA polymerase sigma-70 factor, ECF subfamily